MHSSDSECATPEMSRPVWAQGLTVTTITKETTTTLFTGALSRSLLDQVLARRSTSTSAAVWSQVFQLAFYLVLVGQIRRTQALLHSHTCKFT